MAEIRNEVTVANGAREQLLQLIMSSTTAMHAVMSFLNLALLALVQLKYQHKEFSPFDAHGTIMLLYIFTCIIYAALIALLVRAHHQLPETPYLATLENISLLSGALACGLLLLILAPPFGYFLLAIFGFLVLVKAFQQIRDYDVAAISEGARDIIPNVFHRSIPLTQVSQSSSSGGAAIDANQEAIDANQEAIDANQKEGGAAIDANQEKDAELC